MKKTMLAVFAAGLLFATPSCKKGENDPALSLKSRKGRLTAEWTVSSFVETSTSTQTYVDDTNNPGELLSSTDNETMTFENGAVSMTNSYTNTYDSDASVTSETGTTTASGATITSSNSYTTSNGTVSTENTGAYASSGSMSITFEKDGTFSMTRNMSNTVTYTDDSDAAYKVVDMEMEDNMSTITGTWSFLAKNKADEFKNKERIAIWYKENTSTSTSNSSETYTDKDANDFYDYTDDNYTSTSTYTGSNPGSDSAPDEIWELDMLKSKEVTAVRTYSYTNSGTNSSSYTQGGTTTTSTGNPSNSTSEGTTTMTLTRE